MSLFKRASNAAVGSITNIFVEHPWRSRSFQIAAFIFAVGIAFWLKNALHGAPEPEKAAPGSSVLPPSVAHPIPFYARLALSYMGGFLIGWSFRRFVRVMFLISLCVALLFTAAKLTGCDASTWRERISHETDVAREKARRERDHLKGLLPSGTAAALGIFWGFWRRSRGVALSTPPITTSPPPSMPPKL